MTKRTIYNNNSGNRDRNGKVGLSATKTTDGIIHDESTFTPPPSMQDVLEALKEEAMQDDDDEKPFAMKIMDSITQEESFTSLSSDALDEISNRIFETISHCQQRQPNQTPTTEEQSEESYLSIADCESVIPTLPTKPQLPQQRLSVGRAMWMVFKNKTKDHFQSTATLLVLIVAVVVIVVAMVYLFRPPSSIDDKQAHQYVPGKLVVSENGLLLSQGLVSRIIATSAMPVAYADGSVSNTSCHENMHRGATFTDTRPNNKGGWFYVSNSQAEEDGGVGIFTMDANGAIVDYRMVKMGASSSGGGKTFWNSWITCLEMDDGRCYQVDPTGERESQLISMGGQAEGGNFDSFADWKKDDVRERPVFYTTENSYYGAVRRFQPNGSRAAVSPWDVLVEDGETDYMELNASEQTFQWIKDVEVARANAQIYFPDATSLEVFDGHLSIVSKSLKKVITLDLVYETYSELSTAVGKFDGEPDQIARIHDDDSTVYFAETDDTMCGIFAHDGQGMYTLVNTPKRDDAETTGIAFSLDGKHLYFVLQKAGLLYDVSRRDGLAFNSRTAPVEIIYEN